MFKRLTLQNDFGTFKAFDLQTQTAIEGSLTAEGLVNWNPDRQGDAEFRPVGDHEGVALIFKKQGTVNAADLVELDGLLEQLGGATDENYLRIYFMVTYYGYSVWKLDPATVEETTVHIFRGDSFRDMRNELADSLFFRYHSELYEAYNKHRYPWLIFDADAFLNWPGFFVEEITFGGSLALLVGFNESEI